MTSWSFTVPHGRVGATVDWGGAASTSLSLGATECVRVVIDLAAGDLGTTRMEARWGRDRECVRSASGQLLWFQDATTRAYRILDDLAIEPVANELLPRGIRGREGLIARSLHDLADWGSLSAVVSDSHGVLALEGPDGCHASVVRNADGVIMRGSGRRPAAWTLETLEYEAPVPADGWFLLEDLPS